MLETCMLHAKEGTTSTSQFFRFDVSFCRKATGYWSPNGII